MVWQPAVEPALLGHSCVAGASPSTVMLHVALVNDLHFWGVRLLADQQNFNEGEFMRRPNVADQRAGPVADSDDDLAPSNELPRVRSDASVDMELGLCQALGTWDPWVTPTERIVDNLRAVKASDTSSSLLNSNSPSPVLSN